MWWSLWLKLPPLQTAGVARRQHLASRPSPQPPQAAAALTARSWASRCCWLPGSAQQPGRKDKAHGRITGCEVLRGESAGARGGGGGGKVARGKAAAAAGTTCRPAPGPIPAPVSPPRRLHPAGGRAAAARLLQYALLQAMCHGAAPSTTARMHCLALTMCNCQAAQHRGQNP